MATPDWEAIELAGKQKAGLQQYIKEQCNL